MRKYFLFLLIVVLSIISTPNLGFAEFASSATTSRDEDYLTKSQANEEEIEVKDPLQPMNKAFYHFNDKLYFWVLKPVAKGYGKVVPQVARQGIRDFFINITTPVRLVNCLLQGKVKAAGNEAARFGINTTIGVLGFTDPASKRYDMKMTREDFGQTLGYWGIGPSIYLNWPFIGPSNARDTVGLFGDYFLDPVNYVSPANIAIHAVDRINDTSLSIGKYEDFKRAAVEPYIAMRQAYMQYRQYEVEH